MMQLTPCGKASSHIVQSTASGGKSEILGGDVTYDTRKKRRIASGEAIAEKGVKRVMR